MNHCKTWLRTAALAVGVWAAATAHAAETPACAPLAKWVRPADGNAVASDALLRSAAQQQVVLLGEHHDNMDHHRWQLYTLAGLHALRPDLVLGLEMFSRDVQPILDRWVAGEIGEAEFLKAVDWEGTWSFDADLYLPLFHFARLNRIPMLALNVDKGLISEVRQKGWSAIPVDRRQGVTDWAPPSREYLEMLAGSFLQHQSPQGPHHGAQGIETLQGPIFKRFVEGQQLWDRAMADRIAAALKGERAPLIVAVMGSGHMMYGFGVPHQLKDLGVTRFTALVPWDSQISCEDMREGFADAVFGLPSAPAKADDDHPRLGVYLEPAQQGVRITQVMPDSVAAATTLQAGDVIENLAGRRVVEVADVVGTVRRIEPGTWLPLVVRRDGKRLELTAKFPPLPG